MRAQQLLLSYKKVGSTFDRIMESLYDAMYIPRTQMGPQILEDLIHKNGAGQPPQKEVSWVLGILCKYPGEPFQDQSANLTFENLMNVRETFQKRTQFG